MLVKQVTGIDRSKAMKPLASCAKRSIRDGRGRQGAVCERLVPCAVHWIIWSPEVTPTLHEGLTTGRQTMSYENQGTARLQFDMVPHPSGSSGAFAIHKPHRRFS